MAKTTGIAWTDSTYNWWWGCTKIEGSRACEDCYAESTDKRAGGGHWGRGAPRRLISKDTRTMPRHWNKEHIAAAFFEKHGHPQRVFTESMGDAFDNEVPKEWRDGLYGMIGECHRLEWQPLTKRLSNVPKMVPAAWKEQWPRHAGLMITVVNQAEADRDIPRLVRMKKDFGIPWVGISYEPAEAYIDFSAWIDDLDWIIFGGKSGARWRTLPMSLGWAYRVKRLCELSGTAFFMKQVNAFRPTDEMIPPDLMVREWPDTRANWWVNTEQKELL